MLWNTDIVKSHWTFSALYVTASVGTTASKMIEVDEAINAPDNIFEIHYSVVNFQSREASN